MSFWEEFGQRITKESQKAIQKTKDIASVVTMNADISDSKRKIDDLYRELGQLLVSEAFAGATAAQLRGVIEEENADSARHDIVLTNWKDIYEKVMYIRSEEEVIAINEAKIEEIKAESKCPHCGKIVTRGMSFCPECGAKLAEPSEAAPSGEAASSGTAAPSGAAAPASDGAAVPSGEATGGSQAAGEPAAAAPEEAAASGTDAAETASDKARE